MESSPPEEERAWKRTKSDDDARREKNHPPENNNKKKAGQKPTTTTNDTDHGVNNKLLDELNATWKKEDETETEEKFKAMQELIQIYGKELDWLLSTGIEAFHRGSTTDAELGQLQQQLKSKDEQLKTLQKIKEDQSKTIQVRENSLKGRWASFVIIVCFYHSSFYRASSTRKPRIKPALSNKQKALRFWPISEPSSAL